MKILGKFILNIVIYAALVVALVFGLPKLLTNYLGTPYPMAAVTSGSMWPALKTGDLVFIEGAGKGEVAVGDIVVFRNEAGPGFTIHRIVKLDDNTFVTKGDANFSEDAPATYERLIGRAFLIGDTPARIPYLGSITMVASRWRGMAEANGQ